MDNEAVALDAVHRYVWSGFYDTNEIVQIITESIFDRGEIDPKWLRAEIERAFQTKFAEEKSWPETTDCDRLDQAFETLEGQGILALQNAGNEQSDGITDVTQLYHDAGREQSDIVGYCFYHGQDVEGVLKFNELYLTYGDILGDADRGVEIGRRIKHALEAVGFAVEWDGSVKTRLLLKGIKWQRRYQSPGD